MNKRDAFKEAKKVFPNLKPTLPGGFTAQNGIVMVPETDGHTLVLYNKTDLYRMRSMIDAALGERTIVRKD